MKTTILLLLVLFLSKISNGQVIPIPENYSIEESISGDLDNDGIDELVVAYNTQIIDEDSYESIPRELIIYKWENEKWSTWKKSSQALYGSRDGGMMGDPFEEIKIENGILLISHFGGSSWKWGHTDKYRFQNNDFYLIGYTSLSGKNCEHWKDVDFNLSTGKMIVKVEYENCETETSEDPIIYKRENETIIYKGIIITLKDRREKETSFVTPKYGHDIHIQ